MKDNDEFDDDDIIISVTYRQLRRFFEIAFWVFVAVLIYLAWLEFA